MLVFQREKGQSSYLLLLQGVLQVDLFVSQSLQIQLLLGRLTFELLDLAHQLVDQHTLLLLQGLLQLHLFFSQLVQLTAQIVGQVLLLLLVVQCKRLFLFLEYLFGGSGGNVEKREQKIISLRINLRISLRISLRIRLRTSLRISPKPLCNRLHNPDQHLRLPLSV